MGRHADQFHTPYRYVILSTAVAVVFAAIGLARFGFTMLLPSMETVLSFSGPEAGLLAMANLTGYLLLSLTAGLLANRWGMKTVIVVSLAAVTVSLFLTGLAGSFQAALVTRFVTGLGSGGANVPVMALLARWFKKEERGLASGIAVSGTSLGLIVTGLTIPLIVNKTRLEGLPDAWFFLGLLSIVAGLLALLFLRDTPRRETDAADLPLKRTGAPLREIFRTRGFVLLSVVYFLYGFSYIIYATFFTRFLIGERGYTEQAAGTLWFLVGAGSVVSGLVWGFISDRIGRSRALMVIFLFFVASYGLFTQADPVAIVVSSILFSLCSWSVPAIMAAAAGDLLGEARAATGFGIMTFTFGIGQVAGPPVAGFIAGGFGSYGPAFFLAAAACLAATVFLFFGAPPKRAAPESRLSP